MSDETRLEAGRGPSHTVVIFLLDVGPCNFQTKVVDACEVVCRDRNAESSESTDGSKCEQATAVENAGNFNIHLAADQQKRFIALVWTGLVRMVKVIYRAFMMRRRGSSLMCFVREADWILRQDIEILLSTKVAVDFLSEFKRQGQERRRLTGTITW